MTLPVHLILEGANTGVIEGYSSQTTLDRENTLECLSFSFGVHRAVDKVNQVGGSAMHDMIRVTKRVDKASPLLMQMWAKAEQAVATFNFYRPSSKDGADQLYYEIKCEGVRIVSIDFESPEAIPGAGADPAVETITFALATATVAHTVGGTEAELLFHELHQNV